jgi:hypothetical protein
MTLRPALIAAAGLFAFSTSAEAASFAGCPISGQTDIRNGPRISISWIIEGDARNIAFGPTGIQLGGGIGNMTAAEAAFYEPVLADLRAAASARRKVTVFYDSSNRAITAIRVNWNDAC